MIIFKNKYMEKVNDLKIIQSLQKLINLDSTKRLLCKTINNNISFKFFK
jgi:hypothetical protein